MELKGREFTSPFPLLSPDLKIIKQTVSHIPPLAQEWMKKFWPGPLTLIFMHPNFQNCYRGKTEGSVFEFRSIRSQMNWFQRFGDLITTDECQPIRETPASRVEEIKNNFS